MIGAGALALACSAVFAGGIIQGMVGFGMGLFSAPITLRVLPPAMMAPINVGLAVFMNLSLFLRLRKDADWRMILPLLIGSACGIWPGTYLPHIVPVNVFKAGVGLFVAVSGAVLWAGWKRSANGFFQRALVGFFSGMLSSSISLGTPPLAIFLAAGNVPKHVFRSSTAAFLMAQNVMSAVAFGLRGAYTAEYFRLLGVLLPFVLGGSALGAYLVGRVDQKLFRRGVMIVLIASGLSLLF